MQLNLLSNAVDFLSKGVEELSQKVTMRHEVVRRWKYSTLHIAQGVELIVLYYLLIHNPIEISRTKGIDEPELLTLMKEGKLDTINGVKAIKKLKSLCLQEKDRRASSNLPNSDGSIFPFPIDVEPILNAMEKYENELIQIRRSRNFFTHFHMALDEESEANLEKSIVCSLQFAIELCAQVVD